MSVLFLKQSTIQKLQEIYTLQIPIILMYHVLIFSEVKSFSYIPQFFLTTEISPAANLQSNVNFCYNMMLTSEDSMYSKLT